MLRVKEMDLEQKVLELVKRIPKGKVITYKALAEQAGTSPRAVGQIMKRNRDFERVKCFKVICSDGSLGGYALGIREKVRRLERDGIEIKNGKIDLEKYFHSF